MERPPVLPATAEVLMKKMWQELNTESDRIWDKEVGCPPGLTLAVLMRMTLNPQSSCLKLILLILNSPVLKHYKTEYIQTNIYPAMLSGTFL